MSTPTPPSLSGRRVLVIEDDAINRTLLRIFLQREGAEVLESGFGEPAVALFGQAEVAVVDLSLPDIDGIEVLTRAREGGNTVPALLLTGEGRSSEHARAIAAGFAGVVSKPADLTELGAALAELLHATDSAE